MESDEFHRGYDEGHSDGHAEGEQEGYEDAIKEYHQEMTNLRGALQMFINWINDKIGAPE